jgi:hypothetical protein
MKRMPDTAVAPNVVHACSDQTTADVVERRSGVDRRRAPTTSLRYFMYGGRRISGRRAEDRRRVQYFDRYSRAHLNLIVLILFLSVTDAFLTLFLIDHGAIEVNPIMAFYLEVGPYAFLFVKYGLTSLGLILLLLFSNFVLRPVRVRAGVLFYPLLAAFVGVVSWQIYLIRLVIA